MKIHKKLFSVLVVVCLFLSVVEFPVGGESEGGIRQDEGYFKRR